MKKILIVDDELHIQISLSYIMENSGYEVFVASDGQEGVDMALKEKPDVIFLDLMMPRKNGLEVCQELRENPDFRDTYIILLTARGQEKDKELANEIGVDEYITKPFSPLRLAQRIKNLPEREAKV